MNYVLTHFLAIFQIVKYAIGPNFVAHLVHLSFFSSHFPSLISYAIAFSIAFLFRISRYLELVTTCD
jgi:hypothetical protein